MKKTHKKLLGICGLALVAAMTIIAASLPTPIASAISDQFNVRVVAPVPAVGFTSPESGISTNNSAQNLKFSYESASKALISLTYTDVNGKKTVVDDFWSKASDYYYETGEIALNLDDYGYGTFNFTLYGYDLAGAPTAQAQMLINYVPTVVDIDMEEDGTLDFTLDYDDDIVDKVEITIKNDTTGKTHTVVVDGGKGTQITSDILKELGGDGDYTITVSSYNKDGKLIYTSYFYIEVVGVPNTGAPDTGGLFQNLNISKEDYAVTVVLVFFVLAVVALGIMIKSRRGAKASSRRKK